MTEQDTKSVGLKRVELAHMLTQRHRGFLTAALHVGKRRRGVQCRLFT